MAFQLSLWTPPPQDQLENALRRHHDSAQKAIEQKLSNLQERQKKERKQEETRSNQWYRHIQAELKGLESRKNELLVWKSEQKKEIETQLTIIHNILQSLHKTIPKSPPITLLNNFEEEIRHWIHEEEIVKPETKTKRGQWSQIKSKAKQLAAFLRLRPRKSMSLRKAAPAEIKTEVRKDISVRLTTLIHRYSELLDQFREQFAKQLNLFLAFDAENFVRRQKQEQDQFLNREKEIRDLTGKAAALISEYGTQVLRLENTKLENSKSKSKEKSEKKRKKFAYPQPFRLDFAVKLLDLFPAYQMRKAIAGPSRCNQNTKTLQSYQRVIPQLLRVDSPYIGFLPAFTPGAGKTALALETIKENIQDYKTALVLLPTETLFPSWRKEIQKWLTDFKIEPPSSKKSEKYTDVVRITAKTGHQYQIVLHKITASLPKSFLRHQKFVTTPDYVLPNQIPESLNEADAVAYRNILTTQRSAIHKKNVGAIKGGLIIVDEAQYLVNAQEICRSVTESLIVLAWANFLAQYRTHMCRLLLMTGTPNDLETPLPFIKLLNFFHPPTKAYEGSWKRTLTSEESKDEFAKRLYVKIDEAEQKVFQNLYMNGSEWKPGIEKIFQTMYGSSLFYVTLAHDPTVFPSVDKGCLVKTCVFRWDDRTQQMEGVKGTNEGHDSRLLFVPMAKTQFTNMASSMKNDLKRFNLKEFKDIPFGRKETKSSVLQSFGTKFYSGDPNPKLNALVTLMDEAHKKHEKSFVFTVNLAQRWVIQTEQFLKGKGYHVITLLSAAQQEQKDPLWIDKLLTVKQKRAILYVTSPKATELYGVDVLQHLQAQLFRLWEDPKNLNGDYVCAFIGGRNTNTGISVTHTLNSILLNVSSSDAMETQAIARTFRNCGLAAFPVERWTHMKVWQFISVPPVGAKKGSIAETNEQYQWQALRHRRLTSISSKLWKSLLPAAGDCKLMHEYNQDPDQKHCVGTLANTKHDMYVYLPEYKRHVLFVAARNVFLDLETLTTLNGSGGYEIHGRFPNEFTTVDKWILQFFDSNVRSKSKSSKMKSKSSPKDWGTLWLSLWTTPEGKLTRGQLWHAISEFPRKYQIVLKDFVQGREARLQKTGMNKSSPGIKTSKEEYERYRNAKGLYQKIQKLFEQFVRLSS